MKYILLIEYIESVLWRVAEPPVLYGGCMAPKETFRRRNYFFLILAHPVHKMWIIQEPNMLELWNKLHFEEENTESIYHV